MLKRALAKGRLKVNTRPAPAAATLLTPQIHVPEMHVPEIPAATELQAGAAIVHLVGNVPRHGTPLGDFVRQPELVNGYPAYRTDGDRMLWWAEGTWHVGRPQKLGTTRGMLTARDDSPVPEDITAAWRAADGKGGWLDASQVRCISDKAMAAELQAGAVVVHLVGHASHQYDSLGDYARQPELVNGRPVHIWLAGARVLWWAKGNWYIGKPEDLGAARGMLTARDGSPVPEGVTAAWRIWDYWDGQGGWLDAPQVRCISDKTMAAELQAGAVTVHLVGNTPQRQLSLGDFLRQPELVNGRPAYTWLAGARVLWWTKGDWYVGKPEDLGAARGMLTARDGSPVPEGIIAAWRISDRRGGWLEVPRMRCISNAALAAELQAGAMPIALHSRGSWEETEEMKQRHAVAIQEMEASRAALEQARAESMACAIEEAEAKTEAGKHLKEARAREGAAARVLDKVRQEREAGHKARVPRNHRELVGQGTLKNGTPTFIDVNDEMLWWSNDSGCWLLAAAEDAGEELWLVRATR